MCSCLEPPGTPCAFFQVLKSQRWEKKQAVTRVFGTNQVQQPSAKVGAEQALLISSRDHLGTGAAARPAAPITFSAPTGLDLCSERSTNTTARDPDDPRWHQHGASRRSGARDGHALCLGG